MIRSALVLAAALSLSACATPVSAPSGGPDASTFALGELSPTEAPALARAAAAKGDTRLIGFIGIALVFPGADRQAADRLGYRVIDGGGDNFRGAQDRARADRAYAFARAWNATILGLSPPTP